MVSTKFINLTPHTVVFHLVYDFRDLHSPTNLHFAPSGDVARLDERDEETPAIAGMATCRRSHGDISGLPDPVPGIVYIVSAFCLSATTRQDVVAPDTGKSCIRTADGKIGSVTRWLRPNQ